MNVVVAGELPLVDEVGRLCQAAGHHVSLYLVEDFFSAVESRLLMDDINTVDVVIELFNESAAAKQELILGLSESSPMGALFLTSTLATSATRAASWVMQPHRVVGFGLLPPLPPTGGVVELCAALQTGDEAIERAKAFWQGLGYETIWVADGPGLVRARTVCCLINEAVCALMEGVASAADIDQAMKLGANYPHGPLEWADVIGLDTVLGVMTGLHEEWGDDRYRPAPLLRRMVAAGRLGRKTGEGFFKY